MKTVRWIYPLLLVWPLFLSGCAGSDPPIQIEGAWARPAAAGGNSAVYFVLSNRDVDDRITGARSDVAAMAQIHATTIDDQGQASMQHQEVLDVPAGSILTFRPGGLHVMLMDLNMDLIEGGTIQVTLVFETYGELVIDVPIESN